MSTRQALPPDFSPREFRAALGMFATGVTIVTARTPTGELVGLTANSFNSVSMDPPLVLWSLSRRAGSMQVFSAGSHYAINILAADQRTLAERFASRDTDRWEGVAFTDSQAGSPLLTGAAASFECFNRSRYEEGDHVIFVGEVERCTHRENTSPLLFHGGKFYTEHPLQADGTAPQPADPRFVSGSLGYLLGQAGHTVYRDFESAVAAHGLTHLAWRVLALLHDAQLHAGDGPNNGALPVGQLARDVLAKQPTVTKLVQRMAEDGLLELKPDAADQRRTLVVATATGLRAADELVALAKAQEAQHLSHWSAREVETLKRMLGRLSSGR